MIDWDAIAEPHRAYVVALLGEAMQRALTEDAKAEADAHAMYVGTKMGIANLAADMGQDMVEGLEATFVPMQQAAKAASQLRVQAIQAAIAKLSRST